MGGKVFFHIGLPKTATTSLQKGIFPAISDDFVRYIGVFQDRKDNVQTGLYVDIYRAVCDSKDIDVVRNKIRNSIQKKSTVLSEEMFMVSSGNTTWRRKLYNIERLLSGIDYELLVTVREPTSAMFSYYVELYHRFGKKWKRFIDCALYDEAMEIFHYKKMIEELTKHFNHTRIHFFAFENLIRGEMSGIRKIINPHCRRSLPVKLSHQNPSIRKKKVVYSRRKIGIVEVFNKNLDIRKNTDKNNRNYIQLLKQSFLAFLNSSVRVKKKIHIPTQEEMEFLGKHLADETSAIDTWIEAKYC